MSATPPRETAAVGAAAREAARDAARPNLLDRAIAWVNPAAGLRRFKQRAAVALAGGYFGGSRRSRPALANWNPGVNDADGDLSPDLPDLRAYSRDLVRRSPLAGGAVNTVVTNVVGTGLALQPAPKADVLGLTPEAAAEWAAAAHAEWLLWAESPDCDITRAQDFYGLQSLAFRSALENGDAFALLPNVADGRPGPYRLAVQLVEADRVSNPNRAIDTATLVAGVESSDQGAPVAYHFSRYHPGNLRVFAQQSWTRYTAFGASGRRRVLHLMDRQRIGQSRGVPYLAPVIEPLKQLDRYTEAEVSAAVVSAAFAVFVKMDPEAFTDLFQDDSRATYLSSAMGWNGSVPAGGTLDAPGKAVNLLPGEDIVAPDLKRPNAAFDPFVLAVLRQIGVRLELPFEVLVKHFTASYSAARAALLEAWKFFRGRRAWLAATFCQPVYETWLAEAVAAGRLRCPGFFADPAIRAAWCAATWTGDGPGSIDPAKEVGAAKERVDMGISTLASESLLHDGVPWDVKHAQRVREVKARRAAGLDADPAAVPHNTSRPQQLPPTGTGRSGAAASAEEGAEGGALAAILARIEQLEARLAGPSAPPTPIVVPAPAVHVSVDADHLRAAAQSVSDGVPAIAAADLAAIATAMRAELGVELAAVLELWRRHGLDLAAPLT